MIFAQIPPVTSVISSATAMQTKDEKIAIAETRIESDCRDYKNDCDPQGCAAFANTNTHMQQATDAPTSRMISPNVMEWGLYHIQSLQTTQMKCNSMIKKRHLAVYHKQHVVCGANTKLNKKAITRA